MIKTQNIKDYLNDLSFPRLSDTENEKKAFKILREKIKNEFGMTPFTQEFSFSTFYSRVYPKLGVFFGWWVIFSLFLDIQGILGILNILIPLGALCFLFLITRKPEKIKRGKTFSSENLVIKVPSKQENDLDDKMGSEDSTKVKNERNVFIMAHVDSKGQRLPIRVRMLSFKLWILFLIPLMLIIAAKSALLPNLRSWYYALGVIPFIIFTAATILNLMNTTDNSSHGAIDNASGMACLLELLNHFSKPKERLDKYDIWFAFTGAEECGTMGIRYFYKMIKEANKEKSFIINIDGIGKHLAYISSWINPEKNSELYRRFQEEAEKIDFELAQKRFGLHTDGLYLKQRGFHGLGFGDVRVYPHVH